MKLTIAMRGAFVRAVMADVPKIDYLQQIIDAAHAAALKVMPPAMLSAYNQHPEFFGKERFYFDGAGYVQLPISNDLTLPESDLAKIKNLEKMADAQAARHAELNSMISGVAHSCTTRKQLAEALPEFEKYLPVDADSVCKTLPEITGVVNAFRVAGLTALTKKEF